MDGPPRELQAGEHGEGCVMANNHWGGGARVINAHKFNKLAPVQPIPNATADRMLAASLAKLNAAHERATKP
jgi:hypothetical protein